jgi:hypothetical protein
MYKLIKQENNSVDKLIQYGSAIPKIINYDIINNPKINKMESDSKIPLLCNNSNIIIKKDNYYLKISNPIFDGLYYEMDNDLNVFIHIINDTLSSNNIQSEYNISTNYDKTIYANKILSFNNKNISFNAIFVNKLEVIGGINAYLLKNEELNDLSKILKQIFIFNRTNGYLHNLKYNDSNINLDKYIFINKYYELICILTCSNYLINIPDFEVFPDDKIKKESNTNKILKFLKTNDTKTVMFNNIINLNNNIPYIDFNKINTSITHSTLEIKNDENLDKILEKIKTNYYYIYNKYVFIKKNLLSIFCPPTATTTTTDKINLINLNNLYSFDSHLAAHVPRDDIEKRNMEIDKKLIDINKKSYNFTDELNKEIKQLFIFSEGIQSINNLFNYHINELYKKQLTDSTTSANTKYDDLNLDIIILLIYFEKRLDNYNLTIGKCNNVLPINPLKCIENLMQNSTEYITSDNIKINDFFIKTNDILPLINQKQIFSYGISICVEQSILEIVKLFFWDFTEKKYDLNIFLNRIKTSENNILYKFMKDIYIKKYVKKKDDEQLVYDEFFNLIGNNKIKNVEYSIKGDMISKVSNIINTIHYLLTTEVNETTTKTILISNPDEFIESLNEKIIPFNLNIFLKNTDNNLTSNLYLQYNEIIIIYINIAQSHTQIVLPSKDDYTIRELYNTEPKICDIVNLFSYNDLIEQLNLYSLKSNERSNSIYNYIKHLENYANPFIINFLIENDPTTNFILSKKYDDNNTLLHQYLETNSNSNININLVSKMIKDEDQKKIRNKDGDTYLDIYINNYKDKNLDLDINIIKLLISTEHNYAFHNYVKNNNNIYSEIVSLFCQYNPNIKTIQNINDLYNTPLHTYISNHISNVKLESIKLLILPCTELDEKKNILLIVNSDGNTPLNLYIKLNKVNLKPNILDQLISDITTNNSKLSTDKTSLLIPNANGNTPLNEYLLGKQSFQVKTLKSSEQNNLEINIDIISKLINEQSILIENKNRLIPLHTYINNNLITQINVDIIKLLISTNPDNNLIIKQLDVENNTPLNMYIKKYLTKLDKNIIKILTNFEVNIIPDKNGFTPLHTYLYLSGQDKEIISILLVNDDHKLMVTNCNYTPLHLYVEKAKQHKTEIIELLISSNRLDNLLIKSYDNDNCENVSTNKKIKNGKTPFDLYTKKDKTVKTLLTAIENKNKNKNKSIEQHGSSSIDSNMIDYQHKYLKYKKKYINLKNILK